jgi:hypothetical protein
VGLKNFCLLDFEVSDCFANKVDGEGREGEREGRGGRRGRKGRVEERGLLDQSHYSWNIKTRRF